MTDATSLFQPSLSPPTRYHSRWPTTPDSGIPLTVDETDFRALVSGKRRGPIATGLRALLWIAKWPYHAAISARNFAYNTNALAAHPASVPVLSIGNLTTGGTGKTPLVAWLANHLADSGHQVGLLSRGYRQPNNDPDHETDSGNDEKRLLETLCPGIPHVQDPDRVAGARQAVTQHDCDVLVLDDGFQHRRLRRILDIVLIDATCPLGYGHLLPRGLLREPLAALRRASLVILTRIDQVDADRRQQLKDRLSTWIDDKRIAEVAFQPTGLVNSDGATLGLDALNDSRVVTFCGIGNPEAFHARLDPVDSQNFPDHHHYDNDELNELASWADRHQAELLLTTCKDLVKIPRTRLGHTPLWALQIGVQWVSGRAMVETAVADVLDANN